MNMINWLDDTVYSGMTAIMSPVLTEVVKIITHFGDVIVVVALSAILFAIPKTRKSFGIPVSIAVIVAGVLSQAFKYIFARARPDEIYHLVQASNSSSFPSAHTMLATAFFAVIALIVFHKWKHSGKRTGILIACDAMVVLVGLSRVYLGVHYITDVIAGWIFGFAIAYITYRVVVKRKSKKTKKKEEPSEDDLE